MKNLKARNILIIIFALLIISFVGATIWIATPYQPTSNALANLKSNENYIVDQSRFITFKPEVSSVQGVILYPGGRVDPRAYSTLCSEVVALNITCVIAPMPLNFAFLGIEKIKEVKDSYPDISNWTIVAHSLGGPMASRYLQKDSANIKGIIFLGSYSDVDISNLNIQVVSIRGSEDNLSKTETIESNKKNLPSNTEFITIEGGNHAQWGDFGSQDGDGVASISISEQLDYLIEKLPKLY